MTTKSPSLVDTLSDLITSPAPRRLPPLSGGLILAYTPGAENETSGHERWYIKKEISDYEDAGYYFSGRPCFCETGEPL